MSHSVSVSHTFETGHRLPNLPGKCQSLHGHSWRVEVEVAAPKLGVDGIIVNFSALKKELRNYIDTKLDHGLMLGANDRLAAILAPQGKVFIFDPSIDPDVFGIWPTVENVAATLARVATRLLASSGAIETAYVSRVTVSETSTNTATWEA
jgi:6-pyruvoyltetrahydropterin/6-carboxytetrahydropterin synthase